MQDGKRTDAESLAEQRPFVEALARRLVFDPNAAAQRVLRRTDFERITGRGTSPRF